MLTISGPPAHNEVLIHSVVVAAAHRGQGRGRLLMAHLEDEARRRRKMSATLQVVRANTGAQDFYRSPGYTEYPRPVGPVTRGLAYPSVMMRKTLIPPRAPEDRLDE
jgi:ribosomal protein S18 acetylase RimI-like enzyme